MSDTYCPAGKCECKYWELKTKVPFLGVFNCIRTEDGILGYGIYQNKHCPWPSRQRPVAQRVINGIYPVIEPDKQKAVDTDMLVLEVCFGAFGASDSLISTNKRTGDRWLFDGKGWTKIDSVQTDYIRGKTDGINEGVERCVVVVNEFDICCACEDTNICNAENLRECDLKIYSIAIIDKLKDKIAACKEGK